mmetsp:Transcript_25067/g.34937  ORF Transcript_25067/g.34937 Transcript_25067/m.34937 type:complete len:286 (+) Transcript_25067:30-887(+)|eukprot:CAMPEP_0184480404 /NCGR_PEP_ID=MMETSP0113_2-20130426/1916_1 /TAXON_ID=91329 /ORGANISM="Norrisiella sphaerica, Strain BC52" /LENGTH=285 /DNA_ID=CAMNT_0026858869 /DNA_START=47 /DNA_END=904 /DNA_ORIENTATION=+
MSDGERRIRFRPCIDLRNGKVTQIVGSSLKDTGKGGDEALTNFESEKGAGHFAAMYKKDGLKGGHVIMLGPGNEDAAMEALRAYPGGLQVGGGINPSNARKFLDAGASHVIVTSYVFKDGKVMMDRLEKLVKEVGKDKLVLDLSCRRRSVNGKSRFYVVTDRWQKFTDCEVDEKNVEMLSKYCSEFLVHGVDVEGKRAGIETELVHLLGSVSPIPLTYAGGIRSIQDIELIEDIGAGKVDFTVGSALDIFGGDLSYQNVVSRYGRNRGSEQTCNTCTIAPNCAII